MKDKTKAKSKKASVLKSWKVSVRKKKCQKDSADVALLHYYWLLLWKWQFFVDVDFAKIQASEGDGAVLESSDNDAIAFSSISPNDRRIKS